MDWYRELDGRQRKAFWACFGGWALDAMDVQMYALVMPAIMAAWKMSKSEAGMLGTVALVASSVGGAIAGNLADRFGRVKVLQVSILWFSLFTFLSGLAQTDLQLLAARTLQGLGFGGEWAAGAVLMAEMIAPKNRGKTLAAISSGWSVGYGLAAIIFTVLFQMVEPRLAWRIMFFLGALPAGLILFVRQSVSEPEMYVRSKQYEVTRPRIQDIFRRELIGRTTLAWAICLGVLGGNYTVLTWLPTYLQSEHHLSSSNTGLYLLVNIVGSFLGYNIGGVVADRLGRRRALQVFAALGVISVVGYLLLGFNPLLVMLLGFPLGFAQSGMNAGLAPLLSELFPTRLRATGQGFCYNAGRGLGALFPALVGLAAEHTSLTLAIAIIAACAYAVTALASLGIRETKSLRLEAVDGFLASPMAEDRDDGPVKPLRATGTDD